MCKDRPDRLIILDEGVKNYPNKSTGRRVNAFLIAGRAGSIRIDYDSDRDRGFGMAPESTHEAIGQIAFARSPAIGFKQIRHNLIEASAPHCHARPGPLHACDMLLARAQPPAIADT